MSEPSSLDDLEIEDLDYVVLVDKSTRILVVDDEPSVLKIFEIALGESGYDVSSVGTGRAALDLLGEDHYDLVIVDKNLPDISGLDVMREARKIAPHIEFMVITGYSSYESVLEALRLGAFDYIEKPMTDLDLMRDKVRRALDRQHLAHENRVLAEHLRSAHKELRSSLDALEQSSESVERVDRQVRDAVDAAGRQLKQENVLLKKTTNSMARSLDEIRTHLKKLVKQPGDQSHGVTEGAKMADRAWSVLAMQIKKVKALSKE